MKLPDNAVIARGTSITLSSRLVAVTTTSSSSWATTGPDMTSAVDTAAGSASRGKLCFEETMVLLLSLGTGRAGFPAVVSAFCARLAAWASTGLV